MFESGQSVRLTIADADRRFIAGSFPVDATIVPSKALSILAVLAPASKASVGLLSTLSSHCVLICQSVAQAMESIKDFAADLVLVESGVLYGAELDDVEPSILAFSPARSRSAHKWAGAQELPLPLSADELESFLTEFADGSNDHRIRHSA